MVSSIDNIDNKMQTFRSNYPQAFEMLSQKYSKDIESFRQYISNLTLNYYDLSKSKEEKCNNYLDKITVLNKKTGELHKLKYDLFYHYKNNAIWYRAVSTHLQNQNINKRAIFLTLTSPTEYHPFKEIFVPQSRLKVIKSKVNKHNKYNKVGSKEKWLSTGIYKANPNYNPNCSISDAYNLLKNSFRKIIKDFKYNRKYCPIKYFRVVEPHKDFTPHLHAILYVDADKLDAFLSYLHRKISNLPVGKIYDVQVLKDTKASTSYILKYVRKTLVDTDKNNIYVIDGWKKSNKIRMVTHSRIFVPRYLFDVIAKNVNLSFGSEKYDIIQNLLDNFNFSINYFEPLSNFDSYYKSKTHFVKTDDDYKYFAIVNIRVSTKLKFKDNENSLEDLDKYFYKKWLFQYDVHNSILLEDDFFYEDEEYDAYEYAEKRKVYKIEDFVVYKQNLKTGEKEVFYDKDDFEVFSHI